jgi:hypothetical protein
MIFTTEIFNPEVSVKKAPPLSLLDGYITKDKAGVFPDA